MTKTISRWVLLIVLWCAALPEATACRCVFLDALNKQAVDATVYIAHVRIKAILPGSDGDGPYFRIAVEELTHFKGDHLSEIKVWGGHHLFNTWTSCDLNMEPGQEWVIFAQSKDGIPWIRPCWYNTLYRSETGARDWQYKRGTEELEWLQRFYNKQELPKPDGLHTSYYPNGRIERVVRYDGGKLEGPEWIYYHNGQLYGRGNFRNGMHHGRERWYAPGGRLHTSGHYRKGIRIKRFRIYETAQSTDRLIALHRYNHHGRILRSRNYSTAPWYHLREKRVYKRKNQHRYVLFHPNGRPLAKGSYQNNLPVGTIVEFDDKGKMTKRWRYGADGKRLSFEQF